MWRLSVRWVFSKVMGWLGHSHRIQSNPFTLGVQLSILISHISIASALFTKIESIWNYSWNQYWVHKLSVFIPQFIYNENNSIAFVLWIRLTYKSKYRYIHYIFVDTTVYKKRVYTLILRRYHYFTEEIQLPGYQSNTPGLIICGYHLKTDNMWTQYWFHE